MVHGDNSMVDGIAAFGQRHIWKVNYFSSSLWFMTSIDRASDQPTERFIMTRKKKWNRQHKHTYTQTQDEIMNKKSILVF